MDTTLAPAALADSTVVQESTPRYGIVVARDVMMAMRDGVRLATDIYRPAIDGEPVAGRFPTILGRTSYDKTDPIMWVRPVADYFVPRGYAVVLQDLRGRQRSEGTGQYFQTCNPTEGPDGYDTVEWVAAQPWSNGRVGVTGSSHGSIVQQVMALYRPPHLTALWPDVGPTNIYHHMSREGGAMALHLLGRLGPVICHVECMGCPPLHADQRLLRRHRPQEQAGILRDEALPLPPACRQCRLEAVPLCRVATEYGDLAFPGDRCSDFAEQLWVPGIEGVPAVPCLQADGANRELPFMVAQVWVRGRGRLQSIPRLAEGSLGSSGGPHRRGGAPRTAGVPVRS